MVLGALTLEERAQLQGYNAPGAKRSGISRKLNPVLDGVMEEVAAQVLANPVLGTVLPRITARSLANLSAAEVLDLMALSKADVRKTLSNSITGVTQPGNIDVCVRAVLLLCHSTGEMYEKLGLDAQAGAQGNYSESEIVTGYMEKANEVMKLHREKALSDTEAEVQIALLRTIKDVLVLTKDQAVGAEVAGIVNQSEEVDIPQAAIDRVSGYMQESGKVRNSVLVWLQAQEKPETRQNIDTGEIQIDVAALKKAVETRQPGNWFDKLWVSVRSSVRGERTMEDKMKDVLGYDQLLAGGDLKRKGVKLMDPLSMKAIAQAA
jgi:hypothetical protein